MEEIQLSETEQRYFGDLFTCCDSDKSGKIPIYKASELFRSANLPHDVLKQITENWRGNHLGRRQFYSALKLIAAYQAGLPLRTDLDVPLPRLSWPSVVQGKREQQHISRHLDSPDLIQLSDTDPTPSPHKEVVPPRLGAGVESGNLELRGACVSPTRNGLKAPRSPEASSTASDSPTPTNSVQEKQWVASAHWHGIVCEEQRQLLGTEEESSDRHSSDEEEEEGDGDGEVWLITDEQRDYYSAQFRSLQPDPEGLVAGPVARLFFEKSRLPVHELRKIWQLADVTKDGALSLEEFNTAMHLVVLRRNNIPLPDILPLSLVPSLPPPTAPPPSVAPEPPSREDSPPSLSPPTGEPSSPPRSKEWTKFVDSPTSSVSSPGPKPVNFDFHKSAVEQDPKILHPVALRLTPEGAGVGTGPTGGNIEEGEPCRSPRKLVAEPQPIPYEQLGPPGSPGAGPRPIQRPQPKKPSAPGPGAIPPPPQPTVVSVPSAAEDSSNSVGVVPTSGATSLPPPVTNILAQNAQMGPKKEPPPPPPPRPYRTHTRSSSLDLNRLGRGVGLLGTPPTVPPRISPSTTSPKKLIGQRSEGDVLSLVGEQGGFADFTQFGQEEDSGDGPHPRKHGAFEVYRKPLTRTGESDTGLVIEGVESPSEDLGHRHRPREALRRLQEQNWLLSRVCQELAKELAEVQVERAALELRLEQLRPSAAAVVPGPAAPSATTASSTTTTTTTTTTTE